MTRLLIALISGAAGLLAATTGGSAARHSVAVTARPPALAATSAADLPQPPIADPQQLAAAYEQAFAAGVNSGDFTAALAFFAPDAGIDSDLSAGGASGAADILAFFQKLPTMSGFAVEVSNVVESDPYIDLDWRYRAAPGSLRGYLDGHDSFTIAAGLISQLSQRVDPQAAAEALMPPPAAPVPRSAPVAKTKVTINNFKFAPAVIKVPVGSTVTWVNNDADSHTVTTDDTSIDSGVIEQSVSVSLSFPLAGEYPYYCTIHPGMRGKVIVGP